MKRITKSGLAAGAVAAAGIAMIGMGVAWSGEAIPSTRDGEETYVSKADLTVPAGQVRDIQVACDQTAASTSRDRALSGGFMADSWTTQRDISLRSSFPTGSSGFATSWAMSFENTGASSKSVQVSVLCLDVDGNHY